MERPPKRLKLSRLDFPAKKKDEASLQPSETTVRLAPGHRTKVYADLRRDHMHARYDGLERLDQQESSGELHQRDEHGSDHGGGCIEKRQYPLSRTSSHRQMTTVSATSASTKVIFTTEILTVLTIPGVVLPSGPPIGPTIETIVITERVTEPISSTSTTVPYSLPVEPSISTATLSSRVPLTLTSTTNAPIPTSSFSTITAATFTSQPGPPSRASSSSSPPLSSLAPVPSLSSSSSSPSLSSMAPVPSVVPSSSSPPLSSLAPVPSSPSFSLISSLSSSFALPSLPPIPISEPSIIVSVGVSVTGAQPTEPPLSISAVLTQPPVPAVTSLPVPTVSLPPFTSLPLGISIMPPVPASAESPFSGRIVPQVFTGGPINPLPSQTGNSIPSIGVSSETNVSASLFSNEPAAATSPPASVSGPAPSSQASTTGPSAGIGGSGGITGSGSSQTRAIPGGGLTTMRTSVNVSGNNSKAPPQPSNGITTAATGISARTTASQSTRPASGPSASSSSRSDNGYVTGYYGTGYTPGVSPSSTPTIASSGNSTHGSTGVSTAVIAGSVVGALAGLGFLLVILLLAARWWRARDQRHERLDDDRAQHPPMSTDPADRTGFFSAGIAGFAGARHADDTTQSPRGFERLSGRKLPSQWSPGMIGPVGPISSRSPSQADTTGAGPGYSSSALYPSGGTNRTGDTMDRIEREAEDPFADPPAATGGAAAAHNADETFQPGPARMPTLHTPTHPHASFLAAPGLGQRGSRTTLGSRFSEEV